MGAVDTVSTRPKLNRKSNNNLYNTREVASRNLSPSWITVILYPIVKGGLGETQTALEIEIKYIHPHEIFLFNNTIMF